MALLPHSGKVWSVWPHHDLREEWFPVGNVCFVLPVPVKMAGKFKWSNCRLHDAMAFHSCLKKENRKRDLLKWPLEHEVQVVNHGKFISIYHERFHSDRILADPTIYFKSILFRLVNITSINYNWGDLLRETIFIQLKQYIL